MGTSDREDDRRSRRRRCACSWQVFRHQSPRDFLLLLYAISALREKVRSCFGPFSTLSLTKSTLEEEYADLFPWTTAIAKILIGSHVTWNFAVPDPIVWCRIHLFLCALGITEKRFHCVHLGQRPLEASGSPPKLVGKRFWRGMDLYPMEWFGIESKIVLGGECSCRLPLFCVFNSIRDRQSELSVCASWKSTSSKKQQRKRRPSLLRGNSM